MKTSALSFSASVFSPLLSSNCIRYGIAKPWVWPRRRGRNRRQLSNFRSDSPLNFTSFEFKFWNVRDSLHVCCFLMLRPTAGGAFASTFPVWTVAGCFHICCCRRFLCSCKPYINQHPVGSRFRRPLALDVTVYGGTGLMRKLATYTVRLKRTERN
jgi:hypothetical protein